MQIKSCQPIYDINFSSKLVRKSRDVSTKTIMNAPKVMKARQIRNFIDDLQLISEDERLYYSDQMLNAKFKPRYLKCFVSKILKIV